MGEIFDVIVIGGGPAGLTAAQYAARANLKVIVLASPQDAGAMQLAGLIENYPGLTEPLSGRELLDLFREQARNFGADYREEKVLSVQLGTEIKEVYGLTESYQSRSVIIASGSMSRPADIPGEARYLGKGVSYCATCDAPFFRGLTVCVVGDGEETLREAEYLAGFAKQIYLLSARTGKEPEGGVPFQRLSPARLVAIEGDDLVRRIRIRHLDGSGEEEIPTDGVFIYLHGATPAVDFLDSAVTQGETSCILTHQATQTSLPGVFAAGDVTCSAVRQVVVSAAYGCIATLEAEKYLHQRPTHRFDWAKNPAK